jgi:hypothetical protein
MPPSSHPNTRLTLPSHVPDRLCRVLFLALLYGFPNPFRGAGIFWGIAIIVHIILIINGIRHYRNFSVVDNI